MERAFFERRDEYTAAGDRLRVAQTELEQSLAELRKLALEVQ